MGYRINGFEQMNAFYSWVFNNQDKNVKPQHISLYFFLMNQNNRNNWVEWFKCPYELAMAGSGIGNKKTYYDCLRNLQEWNLILYEKGVNTWKAPVISLVVLNRTSTDTATVPQSTPLLEPLPTHIYKLITNNIKPIEENFSKVENFIQSLKTKETIFKSDNNKLLFENFRKEYPGTKRGLDTEFKDFQKQNDWEMVLPRLKDAIIKEIEHNNAEINAGRFVPPYAHLKTWISQRRWEQEFGKIEKNQNESKEYTTVRRSLVEATQR